MTLKPIKYKEQQNISKNMSSKADMTHDVS